MQLFLQQQWNAGKKMEVLYWDVTMMNVFIPLAVCLTPMMGMLLRVEETVALEILEI